MHEQKLRVKKWLYNFQLLKIGRLFFYEECRPMNIGFCNGSMQELVLSWIQARTNSTVSTYYKNTPTRLATACANVLHTQSTDRHVVIAAQIS